MPVVPITRPLPSAQPSAPPPPEPFVLMAAAQMHSEGRLVQPMPFPDNRNRETDFDSRFPKDLKSGIMNDLKPQDKVPPLARKI